MTSNKNILLILPFLPFPLSSGGAQAILNGIEAIPDDFHVFITYWTNDMERNIHDEEKLKELLPGKNVSFLPYVEHKRTDLQYRILRQLWHKLNCKYERANLVDGKYMRFISAPPLSNDFIKHVNDTIKEHHINIVQAEMLETVSTPEALLSQVKTVFVHHELGFCRHELEYKNEEKTPFRSYALNVNKMMEIASLNQFNAVITLSEIDKNKLIEAGVTVPVHGSFAIVRPYHKRIEVSPRPKLLSFVGLENHSPNADGIRWFLSNCWKELKERDSKYQLQIIGNWKEQTVKELTSRYEDVRFTGFVEDLYATISGTTMIVPLRIGSGIRMKILEAANIGVPFVSTSVGAEGLGFVDGENCFIADDPAVFVEDIIKLSDHSLREQFIRLSANHIQAHYSLAALKQSRKSIYESILKD